MSERRPGDRGGTFGQRLRYFRETYRIHQLTLAAHARISRSFLSALENDKRDPTLSVFLRLCVALDRTPEDMLRGLMPTDVQPAPPEPEAPPLGSRSTRARARAREPKRITLIKQRAALRPKETAHGS